MRKHSENVTKKKTKTKCKVVYNNHYYNGNDCAMLLILRPLSKLPCFRFSILQLRDIKDQETKMIDGLKNQS